MSIGYTLFLETSSYFRWACYHRGVIEGLTPKYFQKVVGGRAISEIGQAHIQMGDMTKPDIRTCAFYYDRDAQRLDRPMNKRASEFLGRELYGDVIIIYGEDLFMEDIFR